MTLVLTPHGHLVLVAGARARPASIPRWPRRLRGAFERGSGHGLLWLGADEVGTALPPVYSYWREFGARYVTALCTQPDIDAPPQKVRVPMPPDEELDWMVLAAPPMTGAEYLTAAVLGALWQELDAAFGWSWPNRSAGYRSF